MRVSGDVVAPFLGFDASLEVGHGVAHTHSAETPRHSTDRVTRRTGEESDPARCRAPTQRQSGSSWEGVHAACGHPVSKEHKVTVTLQVD